MPVGVSPAHRRGRRTQAVRDDHGAVAGAGNRLDGRSRIVDPSTLPKGEVVFGVTVVVKDLDFGDNEEFTLVGAGDEDYDNGKIQITSPLAQGLVGHKVGDKVEIQVPRGTMKFEILEIRPAVG